MAARLLKDGQIVFAGIGVPLLAATLAQHQFAPHLTILFEGGTIGPRIVPGELPPSTNEQRCTRYANMVLPITDVLLLLQRGYVDVGFMGGAQIDRFGNLNTTVIGDYEHPKVRLPGSGGACEIAIHAKQILVIMRQAQRSFVEELHFRTSPGHSGDPAHDAARGWWGSGPTSVVTDLGTYGFDETTGEMTLRTTHPGVSLDDVRANMGWEPKVAAGLGETPAPTAEELRLIREELDPQGIYTK